MHTVEKKYTYTDQHKKNYSTKTDKGLSKMNQFFSVNFNTWSESKFV